MAISRSDCAALILAGGKSSRMGRCKALLSLEGRTFLQRLTGALDGFPHLYLSANDPALARGFPGTAVADRYAGAGPLAGLHAALSASRWPYLFCVPCDLPLLPASLAQPMLDAFPEGCDALCAWTAPAAATPCAASTPAPPCPPWRRSWRRGSSGYRACSPGCAAPGSTPAPGWMTGPLPT